MVFALFFSAFVISTCGLVYELISGALASYLLGDSVTQFSTVIGAYLFSMGIGSYLTRYVKRDTATLFIQVELLIGLVGGFSAAVLFLMFEQVSSFRIVLYTMVGTVGILVGLEIPLLMRMLKDRLEFSDLVSKVFTFDYVGALVASILFPLVLVPRLGLMRTCFLFGVFNTLVALWTLRLFGEEVRRPRWLRASGVAVLVALVLGFAYSEKLMFVAEEGVYPQPVIYARSSPYQRIVFTRSGDELRLYLNGHLQFSSRDEYRYHEGLIHPGLQGVGNARRVLVLGGGDGLAVREILKYPSVESVRLVDLDPEMTRLFSTQEFLTRLNGDAFNSPRVRVTNGDAFVWLRENRELYDFIVVDFPDPTNYSVGKLYSTTFFKEVARALAPNGAIVVQSTSPLFARKSYWCVDKTLRAAGFHTTPYHVYVPTFGEWGFVIASKGEFRVPDEFPAGLRYVNAQTVRAMLSFPPDMQPVDSEINRLNNQVLVRYYEDEWGKYAQ